MNMVVSVIAGMMARLEYSSERTRRVRVGLGRFAAIATVCWAVIWDRWLVSTAQTYFALNQLRSGTPAARMHAEFFAFTPFLLVIPVAAWGIAHFARFGYR